MRVGVGLPTTTPGADGAMLVEWARRADAGPFASLGVLDRLLYDSFDPFASLADRKSTRLNSSHTATSRMPSSA